MASGSLEVITPNPVPPPHPRYAARPRRGRRRRARRSRAAFACYSYCWPFALLHRRRALALIGWLLAVGATMVAFAPAVGVLLTAVAAPPERGLNLPATQGSSGTGAFLPVVYSFNYTSMGQ